MDQRPVWIVLFLSLWTTAYAKINVSMCYS